MLSADSGVETRRSEEEKFSRCSVCDHVSSFSYDLAELVLGETHSARCEGEEPEGPSVAPRAHGAGGCGLDFNHGCGCLDVFVFVGAMLISSALV